jgi:hypothetical protein
MYIQHQNLYVEATSKKNANATLVFVFLHRLVEVRVVPTYVTLSFRHRAPDRPHVSPPPPSLQVFTQYFQRLEEESIRDNFVIIYELLDELMDFGYPQFTETQILKVSPRDKEACAPLPFVRPASRRPSNPLPLLAVPMTGIHYADRAQTGGCPASAHDCDERRLLALTRASPEAKQPAFP